MRSENKFRKYGAGIVCLLIVIGIFGGIGSVMGLPNMLNTIMKTAHDLLLNTVFYLMAICVITGALGRIFVEFGVVTLLERILRPLMKPLFNLPGVASLGAVMTFLSDNPAIISLAKDKRFSSFFRKYQLISLTNFGTAFGMGLLVIVFMVSNGFYVEPFIGLLGAFIGCIISTRLMQRFIIKMHPNFKEEMAEIISEQDEQQQDEVKETSMFTRILNSLLDGGKTGVDVGLSIIPGVLIISTLVMILTFSAGPEGYSGAAYEGIGFLPWAAGQINFIFDWLFGFGDPHLVAFPITALGAVGAALGLVPEFVQQGWADGNAIAVFTAIGMCWSGYLSTHTAMLDALGYRKLTSKAILAHTVGGLVAGISAHWIYMLFVLCFGSPESNKGFKDIDPVEIRVEYLGENKVCTTVWVGKGDDAQFKGGRVFEDGADDRFTDTRSMAWYICDMLDEYTIVEGEKNGPNFAKYSAITIVYDKEFFDETMPEKAFESLKKEISAGLDFYRSSVALALWERSPEYLNDKQRAKLDELIKVTVVEGDNDIKDTHMLEGIVSRSADATVDEPKDKVSAEVDPQAEVNAEADATTGATDTEADATTGTTNVEAESAMETVAL